MSYKVPVNIWNQVDAFRRFLKKNGTSIKEYRKEVERCHKCKMEEFLAKEKDISHWLLAAFEFKKSGNPKLWIDLGFKWKSTQKKCGDFRRILKNFSENIWCSNLLLTTL